MKLISDLFMTDYGLMSLGVIVFVIFMAVWFRNFFQRNIEADAKARLGQ